MDTLTYCLSNKELEIRDVFKYLYQSVYGCEHLVKDGAGVLARIEEERAFAEEDTLPELEPLGGDFARLHLKILNRGLSARTLCRLFTLSAREKKGDETELILALLRLEDYAKKGQIPFSADAVENAVKQWQTEGYAPCHHSEHFRATCHPAYRVIHKKYIPLLPLLIAIDKALAERERVTVAIDGRCAAGKTTAAGLLQEIYGCTVFHMDDFFLRPEQRTPERFAEPGGNVDRERFRAEVLDPLTAGKEVAYRRYDCHTQSVCEPIYVSPARLTVTEGVYALHPDLRDFYDIKAFMDITPDLQKERIEKRNPAMANRFFTEWIPMEETYFRTFAVRDLCDVILKQTGER